jgi:hypothetical protein
MLENKERHSGWQMKNQTQNSSKIAGQIRETPDRTTVSRAVRLMIRSSLPEVVIKK